MLSLVLKRCRNCGAFLPLSEYCRNGGGTYRAECRDCQAERRLSSGRIGYRRRSKRSIQRRIEAMVGEKLTVPTPGYKSVRCRGGECEECEVICWRNCFRYPELPCQGCPCLSHIEGEYT